jgi:flagellar basal-body rod modification protein FlgD
MTTTSAASSSTADSSISQAISSSTGSNEVTFDTFLKLLVAQLKNQDPLNPVEGTEFTAQIAQFSSLEQQINSNTYLSKLLDQNNYGSQQLAVSYIGKAVLVPGSSITKAAEGGVEFGYTVSEAGATKSVITISNSDGTIVKTINGDPSKGSHIVTWDGKDDSGKAVEAGTYKVSIKSEDSAGKVVASKTSTYGVVSSVVTEDGDSNLYLTDGRSAALDDVLVVTQ